MDTVKSTHKETGLSFWDCNGVEENEGQHLSSMLKGACKGVSLYWDTNDDKIEEVEEEDIQEEAPQHSDIPSACCSLVDTATVCSSVAASANSAAVNVVHEPTPNHGSLSTDATTSKNVEPLMTSRPTISENYVEHNRHAYSQHQQQPPPHIPMHSAAIISQPPPMFTDAQWMEHAHLHAGFPMQIRHQQPQPQHQQQSMFSVYSKSHQLAQQALNSQYWVHQHSQYPTHARMSQHNQLGQGNRNFDKRAVKKQRSKMGNDYYMPNNHKNIEWYGGANNESVAPEYNQLFPDQARFLNWPYSQGVASLQSNIMYSQAGYAHVAQYPGMYDGHSVPVMSVNEISYGLGVDHNASHIYTSCSGSTINPAALPFVPRGAENFPMLSIHADQSYIQRQPQTMSPEPRKAGGLTQDSYTQSQSHHHYHHHRNNISGSSKVYDSSAKKAVVPSVEKSVQEINKNRGQSISPNSVTSASQLNSIDKAKSSDLVKAGRLELDSCSKSKQQLGPEITEVNIACAHSQKVDHNENIECTEITFCQPSSPVKNNSIDFEEGMKIQFGDVDKVQHSEIEINGTTKAVIEKDINCDDSELTFQNETVIDMPEGLPNSTENSTIESSPKSDSQVAQSKTSAVLANGEEIAKESSSKNAANEASSKTAANEDSSKTVANEASSKTAADEASSKNAANEASSKTAPNEASSKTAANEASSKTAANEASSKTAANEASSKTAANEASSKTAANEASSRTAANEASSRTAASEPCDAGCNSKLGDNSQPDSSLNMENVNGLEPLAVPKHNSWAELFKIPKKPYEHPTLSSPAQPSSAAVSSPVVSANAVPPPSESNSSTKQLQACLLKYQICNKAVSLRPRGLVNKTNWCYVNATLQALLSCPPLYHLVHSLPSFPALQRTQTSTPVLDSMIQFFDKFSPLEVAKQDKFPRNIKNGNIPVDINIENPFEPDFVYKVLNNLLQNDCSSFKHGRQEDAEELVSTLLNALHEEMALSIKSADTGKADSVVNGVDSHDKVSDPDSEDDSWEQVGPRNRSVITRSASIQSSPISTIFCGKTRSVTQRAGQRESAMLQPFFTLQLDISDEKVSSLKDALDNYVSKEIIGDCICPKTNKQIEASRKTTLELLPQVLIMHFKCFVYDSAGSQKVVKNISFDVNLEVSKDIISSATKGRYLQSCQRTYKLFAVVSHHGFKMQGGHYTTDFYHPGYDGWLRADDRTISTVSVQQVLKSESPKVPYLLYYRKVGES